jgi:GPH family glycoside/pentoside/hexuronide:cation symporter
MTHAQTHARTLSASYGLMALPLSFVALPMYVNLPHFYATQFAMSLSTLGLVLMLSRLLDAFIDPWLGRVSDVLYGRSAFAVGAAVFALASLLLMSFAALFFPPDMDGTSWRVLWIACFVSLCHLAYSGLSILHQAWATRLGGGALFQGRVIAWREAAGLVGVVLASLLPALMGWTVTTSVLGVMLLVGALTWRFVFAAGEIGTLQAASPLSSQAVTLPLQQPLFLKLLLVFMLNGIASAVPASLVMFFVEDQIQASAKVAPWFLGVYFLAGVFSLPLWLRFIRQWGLPKVWAFGMTLALLSFACVSALGPGDETPFFFVCLASGVALGADMVVPSALLNRVIDQLGHRGQSEGLYLGWWNLISKFNLALAAGVCLPLLAMWGYVPGVQEAAGASALSLAYGVLPCALKAMALAALWYFWIQPPAQLLVSRSDA